MLWLKPAVFTKVLLVDSVRVLTLNDVALVDGLASIPAMEWLVLVSEFNSGGTTDRARGRAIVFIVVAEFMVHLLSKERLLDCHKKHRLHPRSTRLARTLQRST